MTEASTLDLPARMSRLPQDSDGHPVPWFVPYVAGEPDFRLMTAEKMAQAMRLNLCWICGGRLGAYRAFVLGPMCAVNRVNAEPPSHRECAIYAATHCPFLSNPRRKRREKGLPEGATGETAGISIRRNPGVALVWVCRHYHPFRDGPGWLFRLGDPTETLWFTRGRPSTRDEVLASIESGLPALQEMADADGYGAVTELNRAVEAAMDLLPAEAS